MLAGAVDSCLWCTSPRPSRCSSTTSSSARRLSSRTPAGTASGHGACSSLYKVLWKGYPPEIATWEEEGSIHDDFIDSYEAGLEAEAELDAAAAADEADTDDEADE